MIDGRHGAGRPWSAGIAGLAILVALLAAGLSWASGAPTARARIILQDGHQGEVSAAAWTADSRFIVTASGNGQLLVWDTRGRVVDRARIAIPPNLIRAYVETVAVTPDGKGATAIQPYYRAGDYARLGAVRVAWRFGSDATILAAEVSPPERLQKLKPFDRQSEISIPGVGTPWSVDVNDSAPVQERKQKAFWPSSPDGRWMLRTYQGVLTVKPVGSAGKAIALIGQGALSDFALSMLAGDETDASVAAYPHQEELLASLTRSINGSGPAADVHWALSADGRRLAWIADATRDAGGGKVTYAGAIKVFDLERGGYAPDIPLDPDYDQLHWQDRTTLMASSRSTSDPAVLFDIDNGAAVHRGPPLCFAAPLGNGGLIVGAGTASCEPPGCWPKADAPEGQGPTSEDVAECKHALSQGPVQGLWIVAADGSRRALDTASLPSAARGEVVDAMEVGVEPDTWTARFLSVSASASGRFVAARFRAGGRGAASTITVWDAASGKPLASVVADDAVFVGDRLVTSGSDRSLAVWDLRSDMARPSRRLEVADRTKVVADAVGRSLLIRNAAGVARRVDPATGLDLGAPFDAPSDGELGLFEESPLLWTSPGEGEWTVRSSATGRACFTLYLLPGDRFIAVDPEGRYDSNLPADSRAVRWQVTDAPLRSLSPQTFMRNTYTPRLMSRLLDCAGSPLPRCVQPFKPLGDLAGLDRVLPETRIVSAVPRQGGAMADVEVEARAVSDVSAPNGRTDSGLFDVRLFRDGRLVARAPGKPEGAGDVAAWRIVNAVDAAPGVWIRLSFAVALPTSATPAPVTFSAYAFNADRVKGETASLTITLPPATPRPRRAYVVAIGVDEADEPSWRLRFAAADARAITGALAALPGRDTAPLTLTSTGGRRLATREALRDVLAVLATGDEAARERLVAAGVAAGDLRAVTPDDVVILTFSGHGWADRSGLFYIVPAGGRKLKDRDEPDPASLVSAADLTQWLSRVDAGEMAMVIDACQSAASVDAGDFKPGPMGDPGLGQLAFDKGIRILAAAQADEEAQEDPALGQGVLTYALVRRSLDAKRTTELRLDGWLKEGAERLPKRPSSTARPARHVLAATDDDDSAPVQRPAVFDFNGKPSDVVLRRSP